MRKKTKNTGPELLFFLQDETESKLNIIFIPLNKSERKRIIL